MKSTIVLTALTGSSMAIPFAPAIDAMFGTTFNNEARTIPHPDEMPPPRPIGSGSGTGFPFPTGTGALPPFPTASGGGRPHRHRGHGHRSKALAIDYQLAPTARPFAKTGKVDKRQQDIGSALPSFSLVDPTDPGIPVPTAPGEEPAFPFPTATDEPGIPFPTGGFPTGGEPGLPFPTGDEPELPFPTGGFPTDDEPGFPFPTGFPEPPFPTGGQSEAPFPTGGFPMPTGGFPAPTGGLPGLPTTLETLTRGPQPTGMPEFPGTGPGEENGDDTESGAGQGFWEWLEGLFGGGGKSEMSN